MSLLRLDQALPRVVDLPFASFELLFEIDAGPTSSTNPRLRSGRMKVARLRVRLFAPLPDKVTSAAQGPERIPFLRSRDALLIVGNSGGPEFRCHPRL